MRSVTGQMVLVLYSLINILFVPVDAGLVTAFLVAVIGVAAVNTGLSSRVKKSVLLCLLVCACFLPELLLFSPVFLYGMLECRQYVFAGILGVQCVVFLPGGWETLLLVAFGWVFAGLLQYQAGIYGELFEQFKKTRDDGAERNLLLQEKNQSLLERQDYEIYTATLRERNRIAREIHDNVGHMLSRAILLAGAACAVNTQESVKIPLEQLENTLRTAMTSIRESVHDLHDDSVDLRETLEGLAGGYTFCPVKLTYDMGYAIPRDVKYSFISIVKEALNNTARHSDATKVEITVREHPALFQLVIADNGSAEYGKYDCTMVTDTKQTGADTAGRRLEAGVQAEAGGMGVLSMEERVRALGGTMQIRTEHGFRIHITVPKREEAA